jgi:hypothetical protein
MLVFVKVKVLCRWVLGNCDSVKIDIFGVHFFMCMKQVMVKNFDKKFS